MSQQKPIHRIFVLVSLVSFFGSTAFGAARAVNSALDQPRDNPDTATSVVESPMQLQVAQLKQQERGYEAVLKQEPNNQVALQGLVEVRLQMNDAKGAIAPLEKLVSMNPEQKNYKTLLTQVKQQVGKGDR